MASRQELEFGSSFQMDMDDNCSTGNNMTANSTCSNVSRSPPTEGGHEDVAVGQMTNGINKNTSNNNNHWTPNVTISMTNGCPSPSPSTSSLVSNHNPAMGSNMSITNMSASGSASEVQLLQVVCPFCEEVSNKQLIRKHMNKHMFCSIVCPDCDKSLSSAQNACDVHSMDSPVVDPSQIPTIKKWMKEYISWNSEAANFVEFRFWNHCFHCQKMKKAGVLPANVDADNVLEEDDYEGHLRNHLRYFSCPESTNFWAKSGLASGIPLASEDNISKLDDLIRISVETFSMRSASTKDIFGLSTPSPIKTLTQTPIKTLTQTPIETLESIKDGNVDKKKSVHQKKSDKNEDADSDEDVITIDEDSNTDKEDANDDIDTDAKVKGPYIVPKEHLEAMERLKCLSVKIERLEDAKKYNIVRDADLVLSVDEIADKRCTRKSIYDPYKDVEVIRSEYELQVPDIYPQDDEDGDKMDAKDKRDAKKCYFCLFCASDAKLEAQTNKNKKSIKSKKTLDGPDGPKNVVVVDGSDQQNVDHQQKMVSKFLTDVDAVDHYYKHLKYAPFKCSVCQVETPTERRMLQHIKRYHNKFKTVKITKELVPATELWVKNFLSTQGITAKGRPLQNHASCPVCMVTVPEEHLKLTAVDRVRNSRNLLQHVCAHLGYQSYVCVRCNQTPESRFGRQTYGDAKKTPSSDADAKQTPTFNVTDAKTKLALANYAMFDHVAAKHRDAINEPLDTTFKRALAVESLDEWIKSFLSKFRMSVKFSMQIFVPTIYKERLVEKEKKKEQKMKLDKIRAEEEKILNEQRARESSTQDSSLSAASVHGPGVHGNENLNLMNNQPPQIVASTSHLQTILKLPPAAAGVQPARFFVAGPNGQMVDARMLTSHPQLINQLGTNQPIVHQLYQPTLNNPNYQPTQINQLYQPMMVPKPMPSVVATSNDVLGLVSKLTPSSHERQKIILNLDPADFADAAETPSLASEVLPDFNYFCIFCPDLDSQPDLMSKSEAISHYGSHLNYKPVICLICSRRFSDIPSLKIHHKLTHKVVDPGAIPSTSAVGANGSNQSIKTLQMLYFLEEDANLERWIDTFLRLQKSSQMFNFINLASINNCIVCERLVDTFNVRGQNCIKSLPSSSSQSSSASCSATFSNDKIPKNAGNEISLNHIYTHLSYVPFECIACNVEGIETRFAVVDDKTDPYKLKRDIEDQNIDKINIIDKNRKMKEDEKVAENEMDMKMDADANDNEDASDKIDAKKDGVTDKKVEDKVPDNIAAMNHLKSVHGLTDEDLDNVGVPTLFTKKFEIKQLEDSVHKYLIMKKIRNMIKTRNEEAAKCEMDADIINSDFEDDYEPIGTDGKKRKAWIPEKVLKSSSVCCLHCHAHVSTIKKLKRHHYSIHPQLSISSYSPGHVDRIKGI